MFPRAAKDQLAHLHVLSIHPGLSLNHLHNYPQVHSILDIVSTSSWLHSPLERNLHHRILHQHVSHTASAACHRNGEPLSSPSAISRILAYSHTHLDIVPPQTLHTLPGVLLYQHLLCPNIIILLGRFALQARKPIRFHTIDNVELKLCTPATLELSTPRYVSPHSSLRLWVGFIFIVNTSAYALHWVDTTMGLNDEKALILDFVGLSE